MGNETMVDIVRRIKNRRNELKYSFQDLADLTNMSKSTLQRYESGGIKNIPLDKLKTLAKALKVTPEWIMGWEDVTWPEPPVEALDARSELVSLLTKLNRAQTVTFGNSMLDDSEESLLEKSLKNIIESIDMIKSK